MQVVETNGRLLRQIVNGEELHSPPRDELRHHRDQSSGMVVPLLTRTTSLAYLRKRQSIENNIDPCPYWTLGQQCPSKLIHSFLSLSQPVCRCCLVTETDVDCDIAWTAFP